MKKLIVVTGDSGSGKTTLMHHLIKQLPDLFEKVVTYTSRKKRAGERDGVDYFFRDTKFFEENKDLILVKLTESGVYYGTPLACVKTKNEKHLLLGSRPTAVSKLLQLGAEDVVAIHLSASESALRVRVNQRNSCCENEKTARSKWDEQYCASDLCLVPNLHLNSEDSLETMTNQLLAFLSS
ncbi:hypothetical protein N9L18_00620 [Candidatus Pacebacteria bacterium]|nr:hypothetical protein [Candidatus Paceibacterota bacterium]